jgi:hypothetical protein
VKYTRFVPKLAFLLDRGAGAAKIQFFISAVG